MIKPSIFFINPITVAIAPTPLPVAPPPGPDFPWWHDDSEEDGDFD